MSKSEYKRLCVQDPVGMANRMHELEQQLLERDAVIKKMRESYAEAIEDIEDWGNYADDYFKEKWGFQECIERHRAILSEISVLSEALTEHIMKGEE